MRFLAACVAGVWLATLAAPAAQSPSDFTRYLDTYVKVTREERAQLFAGKPVTKMLEADPSKELAVFGAVWIDAPIAKYLDAMKDIERWEATPSFRLTKKISSPPRAEDFAAMTLPEEDFRDLRSCRISDCELKLPANAIERLHREVDWRRGDARDRVNRIVREQALAYVNSYLQGGNAQLAVYRDAEHPTVVAQELRLLVDRLPPLGESIPHLRRYLLEFPSAPLPGSESFLYWQDVTFGLKPFFRINHIVITEHASGAIVASKMLYASHYFRAALELRVLIRDPQRGPGFWFVTENRSRLDGLGGFIGYLIRGRVRSGTEKGTATILKTTKARLEAK